MAEGTAEEACFDIREDGGGPVEGHVIVGPVVKRRPLMTDYYLDPGEGFWIPRDSVVEEELPGDGLLDCRPLLEEVPEGHECRIRHKARVRL